VKITRVEAIPFTIPYVNWRRLGIEIDKLNHYRQDR
jgi:hypothetical protein